MNQGRRAGGLHREHAYCSRMDSHSVCAAPASSTEFGMGAEGLLQDFCAAPIPAQGGEILCRHDSGFGRSPTGRMAILAAADGLYFIGLVGTICHRRGYPAGFSMPWKHAPGLVPTVGDVDDFHPESYAGRKWCG